MDDMFTFRGEREKGLDREGERERSRRDVATCMFTVHIDYYTSV